jgi:hypothetical protein
MVTNPTTTVVIIHGVHGAYVSIHTITDTPTTLDAVMTAMYP